MIKTMWVLDKLMSRLIVSFAVVALAIAGCMGLAGFGDDSDGARSMTPAPVPTSNEELPPGVTADGVAPGALVEAHENRLERTNYTSISHQRVVRSGDTLWATNDTLWVTNHTRRVAPETSEYVGRISRNVTEFPLGRFPDTYEYWSNGSVDATQRVVSDGPLYGWSQTDEETTPVRPSPLLKRALSAVSLSVQRSDGGVYIVGSEITSRSTFPNPPYLDDPRNVSVAFRVAGDGTVSHWRIDYVATLDGERVRVRRDARITAVGSTAVMRPEWVDTARNRTQAQ